MKQTLKNFYTKAVCFILVVLVLYFSQIYKGGPPSSSLIYAYTNVNKLEVIDLKADLSREYDAINCKRSSCKKFAEPMFCVHDPKKDGISGELWNNGVYEEALIGK